MSAPGFDRQPIRPVVDALSAPYWQAAREGKLALQHCTVCAAAWHPPAPRCASCHSDLVEWRPASGAGVIYSYTDVQHAVHTAVAGWVPYRILLVDLEEGPRIVAGALGACATEPDILGRRVTVVFREVPPDLTLAMFVFSDAPA